MERLSDELVLAVLELLPLLEQLQAARVCRRWSRLLGARALLMRRRAAPAPATLRRLLLAARVPLRPLLAHAPLLRELTVHARRPLSGAELAALERLPHLRRLDVFARSRVLDLRVLPAARRLAELVANDTLAPGLLRALAAAPRLRALHMYGRAHYYPPRELPALLNGRAAHLRDLTLRCAELPDSAYAALSACVGLAALRLYTCWLLTGAGAARVAWPPRLRVLHVTGARMLRPTSLAGFLAALPPGLRELALSATWFGDEHVEALGARLPELRVLELWRCRLTTGGARALVERLPALDELDVDLAPSAEELRALASAGALQRLRCARGPGLSEAAWRSAAAGLRLQAAGARVSAGTLRGGGEGPRADLFYSWCAAPRALPAAREPPALYDDDDEDDYSLFGTDDELDGPAH